MGLKNGDSVFADLTRRETGRLRDLTDEEVNEFRNIFTPLSKARDTKRNNVQTMEKILAEAAFFNLAFDIAACGRDNSRIDRHLLRAAHADKFLLDKHAQDFPLRLHRHVGDFVDVERAGVGFLKCAHFPRAARAVFGAEKLFFHAIRGHGSGIEHHERTVSPVRFLVDHARREFLPRAGRTSNKDAAVGWGEPLDVVFQLIDRRRFADHFGRDDRAFLQFLHFAL